MLRMSRTGGTRFKIFRTTTQPRPNRVAGVPRLCPGAEGTDASLYWQGPDRRGAGRYPCISGVATGAAGGEDNTAAELELTDGESSRGQHHVNHDHSTFEQENAAEGRSLSPPRTRNATGVQLCRLPCHRAPRPL